MLFFLRPKDAVKAIKKRIVGNKNFREIMLALTVSICRGFHVNVQSFVHEDYRLREYHFKQKECVKEVCLLKEVAKSILKSYIEAM